MVPQFREGGKDGWLQREACNGGQD